VDARLVDWQTQFQHPPGDAHRLQQVQGARVDRQGPRLRGRLVAHLHDPRGLAEPRQEQRRPEADRAGPHD
jgi:hypothetical protein